MRLWIVIVVGGKICFRVIL